MIEAFVADTLGFLEVPLAATSAKALTAIPKMVINRKMQEKQDALIEELKKGTLPIYKMADDEFISSLWRVHMAIVQGAGIDNIRLLAKVLLGLEASSSPVYSDQFLRYAQILEALSYEEIRILGMFSKELLAVFSLEQLNNGEIDLSKLHSLNSNALKEYVDKGSDGYEFSGYCASLLRTGLLIPIPVLGGINYVPSPLLVQLIKVIQNNIDCVLD